MYIYIVVLMTFVSYNLKKCTFIPDYLNKSSPLLKLDTKYYRYKCKFGTLFGYLKLLMQNVKCLVIEVFKVRRFYPFFKFS